MSAAAHTIAFSDIPLSYGAAAHLERVLRECTTACEVAEAVVHKRQPDRA